MDDFKRIMLGLGIIAGFMFTVAILSLILQSSMPKELCSCSPWHILPYLIPLLSLLGIFVGGIVYYITSKRVETFKSKILESEICKERDKMGDRNKILIPIFEAYIPDDEKRIIQMLLAGPTTQAKIAKKTGLDKVRVHRIIKSMAAKGVISIEPYGKTRLIKLVLENNTKTENKE